MIISLRKSDILNGVILGFITAIFVFAILQNFENVLPIPRPIDQSKWLILIIIPSLITGWTLFTFYLGRKWPVLFQFGKFVTIGLSNTAIDFGLLNLLMFASGVERGVLFSLFKAISFLFAVVNSYLWNKYWTFDDPDRSEWAKQFVRFFAISGVAFLINVGVASLIVNVIGPLGNIPPILWANFGALVSLIITILWTFFGYKFFVFKES